MGANLECDIYSNANTRFALLPTSPVFAYGFVRLRRARQDKSGEKKYSLSFVVSDFYNYERKRIIEK